MKYQQGQNQAFFSIHETRGFKIHTRDMRIPSLFYGHFPFVRTDRPRNSSHNDNFTFNENYPVRSKMACTKEMVFQQKLLEKSIFHCQNDWSGYGPADQFWLLESALRVPYWKLLCTVNSTKQTNQHVTNTSDTAFITIAAIFLFLLFYTKPNIPSEEVWKILVEIRSCNKWIFCYPDFVQIVCHAYCHQPRTPFCWHFVKFFCIVGWRRLKYKQIFRWDKLVESPW